MDDLAPVEKRPSPDKSASRESSRERIRKRRSRSRERRRRSYSRSKSPVQPYRGGGGGYRGNRNPRFNNNNNNRRSPDRFRRNFNNRFNRSRSRSRDNRRGFNSRRRSRSESPANNNNANYMQQQQQQQQNATMYSDVYGNAYIPNPPAAPQYGLGQFGYDFQNTTAYPPPAPTFSGIACPAPPGMSEGWVPPQSIQPEENTEEKLKREGEKNVKIHWDWLKIDEILNIPAAVAEEKKRQREGLKKQRDQYISRSEKMKRELKELKQQKSDLVAGHGKRSPSPKTNGFIKENEKLQVRIKFPNKHKFPATHSQSLFLSPPIQERREKIAQKLPEIAGAKSDDTKKMLFFLF